MVREEYDAVKFNRVVDTMVENLRAEAKRVGVSEDDVREALHPDINDLDEVFGDGGVARVEHFVDWGIAFSLKYGEIDSSLFDNVLWDLIEEAIARF